MMDSVSEKLPADTVEDSENNAAETQLVEEDDALFLDPNDAVEVPVDDENVPMDDDDDDDAVITDNNESIATQVQDMSKAKMETHSGQVYAVAAHLDPETKSLSILSGGGDDRAYMHKWNHVDASPTSVCLAQEHTDSVSCVAFNARHVGPDATKTPKLAAVGAYDGAIVLYDHDTGSKVKELEGPSDVEWLCFHPKGGTVLLAGSMADGTVWMYHLPSSKCLQVFVGHESGVTAGSFTVDGRWALSSSADGTLRMWAPKTGMSKHVFRFSTDEPVPLTCLAIGGGTDGQLVIVGDESGMAHVCHVGSKKVVASLRHFDSDSNMIQQELDDEQVMELPMSVEAVGFSSLNPNWCATGGVNGVLKIWDLANDGQCRQVCRPSSEEDASNNKGNNAEGGITRLQWHPTLPLVLTSCADGAIRLWDARNGNLVKELTGHVDLINDMAVEFLEPENGGGTAVICTGGDDKTVRVYEIDIAEAIQQPVAS